MPNPKTVEIKIDMDITTGIVISGIKLKYYSGKNDYGTS